MWRKWNRLLAVILAFALVTTTFNSDFASARVFAEGEETTNISDGEGADAQVQDSASEENNDNDDDNDEKPEEDEDSAGEADENSANSDELWEDIPGDAGEDTAEKSEEASLEGEAEEAETEEAEEAEGVPVLGAKAAEEGEEAAQINEYTVTYYVDGAKYREQIYTDEDNSLSLPQKPFKAGSFFMGWKIDGEAAAEGMTVDRDLSIEASFKEIEILHITVEYYYVNPNTNEEVVFDSAEKLVERGAFPVTISSPDNVSVTSEVDEAHPVYYPSQEEVTFTEADIDYSSLTPVYEDGVVKADLPAKKVQYIPYNVTYYYVYLLKDISGDGYTEVARDAINGNLGVMVTPEVKNIEGGLFEKTESEVITAEGQELEVYYTRANYTLRYSTDGGSYVDAVVAPYGSVLTVSSVIPVKAGFEFDGWYLDNGFENKAGSSVELKADTTLYAKWTAKKVDYTVLYLIENADDDGYSFLTSMVKQDYVGATVTETASGTKPSELDRTNFTFKESTSATVKDDGTTVIQVKYSRNVYTITWKGVRYSTGDRKYGGSYGSAALKAKFGSSITQAWTENFNVPYPDYAWSFEVDNKQKFVNIDTMPSGDKEVYAYDFSTNKKQYLSYWLENYEGDGVETDTVNGRTYGLYKTQQVRFNYLYNASEFYEIEGYTKAFYSAGYNDWYYGYRPYTLGNGTPDANLYVDFYYNAKTYPLAFYDYDGELIKKIEVARNADISSYLTANIPAAPVEGAEWLGWYTDAEHAAAYSGNGKMPTGLALYANFRLPEFTITFVDGEEEIQTDTYKYLESAEPITLPDKTGFTFAGWYVDKDHSAAYDFAKPMTANVRVYAKWTAKTIGYRVKYVDAESKEEIADSKEVVSPVYQRGDTVTEKAISITGMLPDANEKSIELDYENNEIVFEYSKKLTSLTYTVKYVLRDNPGVEVRAPKTRTVSGNLTSVTEAAASVDKAYMQANYPEYAEEEYYPEDDVIVYTLSSGVNEIVFTYNSYASGKIVVNYLDMDGHEIKPAVTVTGKAGDAYHISTELNGFTYKKTTDGSKAVATTVNFKDGTVTRYVYFQRNLTVTAKNKTKVYDGTPLVSEGIEDVTVDGLMPGHALSDISFTGSQTEGGSSATTPKEAVIAGASDDYYRITYIAGSLTVTKRTITVTIRGEEITAVYDGKEHTAGYRIESISDPSFLEEYIQFNGDAALASRTHVGKTELILVGMFQTKHEYAGSFTVNYTVSNGYVEVTRRPLTVGTRSHTKEYDGTPLKGNAQDKGEWWINGFAEGESAYIDEMTGSQTDVGSSENYYGQIIWDEADVGDYSITEWQMGTLEVTKASVKVTVKGNKETVNFDGEEHEVTGYEIKANKEAYDVTENVTGPSQADAKAAGTNVGNYSMGLKEASFANNNDNFDVTFEVEDGGLEIIGSKTIKVNIRGKKESVTYDGAEHEAKGYSVEIITPEGVKAYTEKDFTFSGNANVTGTDAGTYPMGLKASDFVNKNSNYTVVFEVVEDGSLEIRKRAVNVEITGNKDKKKYNGKEQKVEGYEASTDYSSYTEADFTFTGEAVAKGTNASNTPYMMAISAANFKNNNSNYDVTFNVTPGQLLIEKLPVTVKVKGDQKTYTYNGEEQKAEGYELSFEESLYKNEFFTAPSQELAVAALKDAGEKAMNLSSDLFKNNNDNFDVTFEVEDGWVKIEPVQAEYEIRVSGNTAEFVYNGEEQSVAGYTVDGVYDSSIVLAAADGKAVASGTAVGEYPMNLQPTDFAATSPNYANIKVTVVKDGKLTITPATRPSGTLPVVTGYEGVYDGGSHTITISGGLSDDTYSYSFIQKGSESENVTEAPKATHVGESVSQIVVTVLNPNYEQTNLDAVEIRINPKEVAVSTESAEKPYDGTELTNSGASADGFVAGESAKVTATGSITEVGETPNTYSIEWDNVDKSDYTIKEELGTLRITPNNTQITLRAPSDSKVYDGKELKADGAVMVSGSLPEGFKVQASSSGSQTNVGVGESVVNDNYRIVNALGEDKTASFGNIKTQNGTLTVTPKAVTISTGSASKAYDGAPLTEETVNIEGLADGESVTLAATGSITEVGEASNTYSVVWDNASERNYTVTDNLGKLVVTKSDIQIILTAASASKTYDGTTLTKADFTISGADVPKGLTITATIQGGQKDAGSSANKIVSYVISDSNGIDRTDSFTSIELIDGTLTVNKAELVIKTGTATKAFDGTALTSDEAEITGLVGRESAEIKATGSQLAVGSSDNTYEIKWGAVNSDNYNITENLGKLTVTENTSEIVLTAASASKPYDGETLKNADVTATGLPETLKLEAVAEGEITDAGKASNKVAAGYKILSGTEDVTGSFTNIKLVDGELEVTPLNVTVTITGNNLSVKYDGKEHSAEGYKAVIGNPLYKETDFTFNGEASAKATIPSKVNMNLAKEMFENKNTNFEAVFEITDGYVEILPLDDGEKFRITATTEDVTREYTGEIYSGFDYHVEGKGSANILERTANAVADFFRSVFGPLQAGAADSGSEKKVEIGGAEYTVSGLYVDTAARDVGDYALTLSGRMKVTDEAGNDVSDQFELEKKEGVLTITPMSITVTSQSASKTYDGTALTEGAVTTDKAWGAGDSVSYNVTGSQTAVGSSENSFDIVPLGTTDLSNYIITTVFGTLTVTEAPAADTEETVTIDDDPTPTAATPDEAPVDTAPIAPAVPAQAVLGARRELETDGQAVLGARRAKTEDATNDTARFFAIIIAAAVAASVVLTGRKKRDE